MNEFYKQMVAVPQRSAMNSGLTPCRQSTMLDIFGAPGDLTQDCSGVTDDDLRALIGTVNVGPFSVTGLKWATDSLTAVFAVIQLHNPDLYAMLGNEGMLCCRAVRGSASNFSNHSWGTAIDMTVGGILPDFNSSEVPRGFLTMYPFFHTAGWLWAAGYKGRTDPMHFELADETIRRLAHDNNW